MEFKQKYESSLFSQNQAGPVDQNAMTAHHQDGIMNNKNMGMNYGYQNQILHNNIGYGNSGRFNNRILMECVCICLCVCVCVCIVSQEDRCYSLLI